MNCEIAGEPDDPMTEKRAAIIKPLTLELIDKLHAATGGQPEDRSLEPPVTPRNAIHRIASKHMQCEKCDAIVALLIFAEGARTLADLEDHARLMYQTVADLDVPTWVIGEPLGSDPLPERPADSLKIWPSREPMQRLCSAEFNPMIDELTKSHCRLKRAK